MTNVPTVKVIADGQSRRTSGLVDQGHPEIWVAVDDPALLPESESFLCYVAAYIQHSQAQIKAGQTLAYGYWLVKFQARNDRMLETWEYNPEATAFVPGATFTLRCWHDQHAVCQRVGAAFAPARPDKLVVLSEGVFEGDPVEGVRYPSPEHMSGWWITTDRYNGDIKSLTTHHAYDLTAKRPDLAQYLALPYGFRFAQGDQEYIWFDSKVADEPVV